MDFIKGTSNNKQTIKGVILIITCKKYLINRVVRNKYRLSGDSINGWKIIYVMSSPELETSYELSFKEGFDSNLLIIKGRDDYVHLFEKVVKAQHIVHNLFDITEGVIKCDDDMLINKRKFGEFLDDPNKGEWRGRNYKNISFPNPGPEHCTKSKPMIELKNYYAGNPQELQEMIELNPEFDPNKYNCVPEIPDGAGGCGGIYYLSTRASKVVVDYFKNCNFNVFYYEPISKSYPFIAEDVGTSFITCISGIAYTCDQNMFCHSWQNTNVNALGFHTHIQGKQYHIQSEVLNVLNNIK